MSASADAVFLDALRRHRLLDSSQLEELQRNCAGRVPDAKAIGKELIRRGWLTPFQVNQVLKGHADQLVLGQYVLLERLGEGGMGQVFKARNTRLGKIDAIKVIRKEKLADENSALRFHREIQATARLSHPNIVGAHDAGQVGDAHYFAMEYVEGTDLSRLVKQKGPLPIATACEYIRQAACGLAHAHEKGLVHRDIKPSNLMVTNIAGTSPVGLLKILDLGLARLAHGGTEDSPSHGLTQDGQLVGTLDYLAPEQALDPRGVDIRADLYSLGCAFYFLLTGRAPFAGTAMIEKLAKHRWEHPVAVEKIRPDVPPEVAAILRKLLAKKPADRYQTPKEVADVLAVLLQGPASQERKRPELPPVAYAPGSPIKRPIPVAAPVRPPPGSAPGVRPAPTSPPVQTAPVGFALGIDLGTTYSVVAFLDSQGRPTSIHNQAGEFITPSVVLFDDAGIVVGKEAVAAASLQPDRVAECVKRDMGCKAFRKKILGKECPPEVVSAFVLRSLKADAVRKLGPVSQAVITVPAYFDENRRQATMNAGRLAGLDVLDIINEPTAAALAYGYQLGYLDRQLKLAQDKPLRVLVYDLGGGTFDVTIVEIHGPSFKAVATDGDVYLGGKDWDARLVEIAARRLQQESGVDPRKDPATLYDLGIAVEAAKRTLSERSRAAVYVNHAGKRRKVELTREEFEENTADLLMRTQNTADLVLRQAGLRWADIDKVLLVGGSTRMPAVERMLTQLAGQPPDKSISPDEAVAHGAALYADLLLQRQRGGRGRSRFALSNVSSHSLGIIIVDQKINERRNEILIPRNTPLPCAATKTFRTQKPGQPKVIVRVVEGESERPEACAQVGVCTIDHLPPNLPPGSPVQVTYAYKENGQLDVTARLEGHSAVISTYFLRENQLQATALHQWAKYVAVEWQKRNE